MTNNNKWQKTTNKILVFSLNLSNCRTLWVPPAYPQKTTNYKQQETTTNTAIYLSILLSSWRALLFLRVATRAPGPRMSNLPTRSLAWKNSLKKSFRSDQDDFGSSYVTTPEYHVWSRPLSAPFLISHSQAGSTTTCEGEWSSCLSLTITFPSAWTSSWDFSPLIQVYSIRVSNLAQKICSKSLSGATKTTSGHHMWQHKSLTCDREWSSCLSLKYCTCYCYAKEL